MDFDGFVQYYAGDKGYYILMCILVGNEWVCVDLCVSGSVWVSLGVLGILLDIWGQCCQIGR